MQRTWAQVIWALSFIMMGLLIMSYGYFGWFVMGPFSIILGVYLMVKVLKQQGATK